MPDITPVILSGGAGTRLWPLSRELRPKQLLQLHSDESLLQGTTSRMGGHPIIVCNQKHRFVVAEHLQEIGIEPRVRWLSNRSGEYVGEDDIVRLEDIYGRVEQ